VRRTTKDVKKINRPTQRALEAGDSEVFSPVPAYGKVQAGQAGFEFFLLPKRIHARPTTTNANHWAGLIIGLRCVIKKTYFDKE